MADVYINGRVYHTMDTGKAPVKEAAVDPENEFNEEEMDQAPKLPRGKQKPAKKAKVKPKPVIEETDEYEEDPDVMDAEEGFTPHKAQKKKSGIGLLMIPVIILLAIIICVVFIVLPKIKAKKDAANNVLNQPAVESTSDEEWDWGEEDTGAVTDESGVIPGSEDAAGEEEWVWDEE